MTQTTQSVSKTEENISTITISNKAMMEAFIAKLSTISNRDFVNEVSTELVSRFLGHTFLGSHAF